MFGGMGMFPGEGMGWGDKVGRMVNPGAYLPSDMGVGQAPSALGALLGGVRANISTPGFNMGYNGQQTQQDQLLAALVKAMQQGQGTMSEPSIGASNISIVRPGSMRTVATPVSPTQNRMPSMTPRWG